MIKRWLGDARVIAAIFAIVTAVASWHKYLHGAANNLAIFRASFFNLIAGVNLYALHRWQHADYFKYSPTFALLMGPFAVAPGWLSAMAWNLVNVFALFATIQLLDLSRGQKSVLLWLVFIELLVSVENFQSNALVTALIIGTFVAFEHNRPQLAGVFVALGALVKIFGGAAALLFLFYPRKVRFISAMLVAIAALILLPLCVTSLPQLAWQYRNWFQLLQSDYLSKEKLSAMNWLRAWFGLNVPNAVVQLTGAVILLLPLVVRLRCYSSFHFRCCFLASLLIFVVLFNHKAESPMFILAVTGVALWYVVSGPANFWHTAIMGLVLAVTSLGSTDLVPRHWRENIATPLVLKAAPCILAWFVIQFELLGSGQLLTKRVAGGTVRNVC